MSIDKNRNLTVQKLKLPETLRKSVRVLSQRQMISKPIRSGILIMRMEISVRYPIRPPKMESSHYLIFMMKTDGCRRSKENCIPMGRQQRKYSEVILMIRMEKLKRSNPVSSLWRTMSALSRQRTGTRN